MTICIVIFIKYILETKILSWFNHVSRHRIRELPTVSALALSIVVFKIIDSLLDLST